MRKGRRESGIRCLINGVQVLIWEWVGAHVLSYKKEPCFWGLDFRWNDCFFWEKSLIRRMNDWGEKKEKKIGSFLIHAELYYRIVDINSFIILRITINLNHYFIHMYCSCLWSTAAHRAFGPGLVFLMNSQSKQGPEHIQHHGTKNFFFFLGRFMLVNFWIVCNLPYLFPTKFLNR